MDGRLSKPAARAMMTLIVLIPLATVALVFKDRAWAVREYFFGKETICRISEAYQAPNDTKRQASRVRDLQKRSSLTRGTDGSDLWTTPDGAWWVPAKSSYAVLYDLAEQDRDIYRTGADGVRPGDVVLDCGANVGVFTKKALSHGASRVIAIEPAPENLLCLRKNLAAEIASGKVTIYEKGVWDKEDILTMHINPTNSAADSFVKQFGDQQELKLPLTTVDKLVHELGLERVDFIKMDIEGAERHAIAGATETIQRFHPRMALCIYHLPDDPVVVRSAVAAIDSRYDVSCGCMIAPYGLQAEVAHFRPR